MTHPAVFRPLHMHLLPILKKWSRGTFVPTGGLE